ncbi:unnamed protein product, partial [Symbiodinium sp. CCMP2456]
MPPKLEEDRPYRGTRAGAKGRKKKFYNIQDDLVRACWRLFSVRVAKATFEDISEGHHRAVLQFNEAGDDIEEDHLVWEDLAGYYPELSEAVRAVVERRGAAEGAPSSSRAPGPKAKWQPKAKAKEPAGPPPAKAKPKEPAGPPPSKTKAPSLAIPASTRDLYQPSRRDPLRRGRVTAEEPTEAEDVGTRSRSQPPAGDTGVDLSAAGGALERPSLHEARRARTPPGTRAAETGFIRDLRLRGSVLASLHCGEQAEPEATAEEQPAEEPTAEEVKTEEAEVVADAEGAAEGAPIGETEEEGQSEGAAQGAQEEEEHEPDAEVEVE